jgi:hypothetical protein
MFTSTQASAVTIDFESIPDLTPVDNFYSSYGVIFQNAISLTAGSSLNEFDYPPSSGSVAIGDDNAPIKIIFDDPASSIFANFTYSTLLTFNAFDTNNNLIGTFINNQSSNLGTTQLISLNFSDVKSLAISGNVNNSFILDDLNFTENPVAPVPEPSTFLLLGVGLFWFVSSRIFGNTAKKLMRGLLCFGLGYGSK